MNNNYHQMYDLCSQHMHTYVLAEMNDGSRINGIVTGVDNNHVYLAIPYGPDQGEMRDESDEERQFGWGPRPFGFGYGPGWYGGFGPRGFRRLALPLAGLVALSVLPWF